MLLRDFDISAASCKVLQMFLAITCCCKLLLPFCLLFAPSFNVYFVFFVYFLSGYLGYFFQETVVFGFQYFKYFQ